MKIKNCPACQMPMENCNVRNSPNLWVCANTHCERCLEQNNTIMDGLD